MKPLLYFAIATMPFNICGYLPGKYQENAARYWEARGHDFESLQGHFYRALMFYNLFEFELALEHINKALELSPQNSNALKTKGEILQWLGKFQEAAYVYQQLLSLTNNKKEHNYGLYSCLTALGKLDEAVAALQTWRKLNGLSQSEQPINPATIKNKSVLIIGERAFGDQIQYIRLAALFKQYEASKVIFAADEKLVPLLSSCIYIDQVIPTNKKPYPLTDLVIKQDEIMFLMQVRLKTIPSNVPYLSPNETLTKYYKQFLSSEFDLKIGICWQAKQGLFHERTAYCNRSMPVTFFKEISNFPNVQLYSLQKGPGTQQIRNINFQIHPLPDDFDEQNGTFVDTAAFMKNLDLVITVDTSIAHLAGALSVPVWVLLPYTADVRWMIDRSDSPWYPSMRLFRQKNPGNWDDVINEIGQILKLMAKK